MSGSRPHLEALTNSSQISPQPPFRLVDRILEHTEERIVTLKNITYNEWYIWCGKDASGIMPWSMLLEVMAQTVGGWETYKALQGRPAQRVVLSRIRHANFFREVRCGEQIITEAVRLKKVIQSSAFQVTARVLAERVAEAEMYFFLY
jgi:3-hydroxyacyl-[acyl-carrier-protein] dehydratase